MFKKVDPKKKLPEMEKEVLAFWEKNKIFEKTLEKKAPKGDYVFYDGPPFATGTPHYGHIVASTIKDVVPRYFTMKGYHVPRVWGWDCHGLPIENIAEKELKISHKKEIEKLGIDKFNETCRNRVLAYVEDWKKIINRLGRFAEMENAYKTMDKDFMESVWWVFKELWDKGLIYEDYRSMHICPRCETTLSQSEVAEGYKDVKDLSVVAKFEVSHANKYANICDEKSRGDLVALRESVCECDSDCECDKKANSKDKMPTYILAWTTTPWTLIGNVALAVNKDIDYVKLKVEFRKSNIKEIYIVAKDRIRSVTDVVGTDVSVDVIDNLKNGPTDVLKDDAFEIEENTFIRNIGIFKGSDLVGKSYKPLFDYYSKDKNLKNRDNGWKVYAGGFVTTEEGTGVVHIAPAFGEDDMKLGKDNDLPFVQHVSMDGTIKEEAGDFAGMNVKEKDNHQKTDIEIIKYLAHKNLLFAKEKYEHSYPHCWRCDTPLINYATSSWFVKVTKIKPQLLKKAQDINWSPKHIKEGRFGNWLEGARDWSISRQRFWASVIPIWRCSTKTPVRQSADSKHENTKTQRQACDNIVVIGSIGELEKLSGEKIEDLHKDVIDEVTFACDKCGGTMRRISDVFDCWFESGSMPYAQSHYPFRNKDDFDKNFPADFIGEGIDQTRAWFYYLHVIATGIKDSIAYKNVAVNGIVLAEDGKKMSKKLKNYPDPSLVMEKYGADALRYYLMSSPVMLAENLNFSEKDLTEVVKGTLRMLWNTYSFFVLYANIDRVKPLRGHAAGRDNPQSGHATGRESSQSNHAAGQVETENILDKWILSELNLLIKQVNENMDKYEITKTARLFPSFVDDLSNWYVRRSRKRFWKSENDEDKDQAYQVLHYVLIEFSKLIAPFMPFVAEEIYKNLTNKESVHLEDFPQADEKLIDEKLSDEMMKTRIAVNAGLAMRASEGIKVRQPLAKFIIKEGNFNQEMEEIIKEELNVKKVVYNKKLNSSFEFDTKITEDLLLEGLAREIIRYIQEMRKKAGYEVDNRIIVGYNGLDKVFDNQKLKEMIKKEVLATEIKKGEVKEFDLEKELELDKKDKIRIWIRK